jgi:peptide/nickel transport system substrate-binding protein
MIPYVIFLGLILLPLWPDASASPGTSNPKTGGTLRFGLSKDIADINPFQRTFGVNINVASTAFECLLAEENGVLKPAIATGWETSKDGLQYTFKLRKGVKFHNGKAMTVQDVIWSMQYAMDPKNRAHGRDSLMSVASLTAPEPFTLRVTLKEPYVPFISPLSSIAAFPLVPQGSVPPGGEKMSLYPPGTGPFMMVDYKPNQLIVFKKFDEYRQKGLPYLDSIHFRESEDDMVRFTALRTGDFDMIERIPYDQALRIQKGELKGINTEIAKAVGYRAILFNTEKTPFNNVKVRQAIAYAIDKEKLLVAVAWGFGIVADQKILKGSPWHIPLQERKRDLEKAKALLREAGYPASLKVKAQMEKRREAEAQLLQSQLKDGGIDLELEFFDYAKHQNDMREGNYLVSIFGGGTASDPDLTYYTPFHTDNRPKKISNFPRYSNPKVDRLLEEGRIEPDIQKRYRIYKEAVETIHEEVPQITLGFTPYIFAFRSHVKGFEVEPKGHFFYGLGGLGLTWLDR